MKKYKVTIEEIGTDNVATIECEDFIVSVIKKKVKGINFHDIRTSKSKYTDLARLNLAAASHIHFGFNEANKEMIDKILKEEADEK